LFDWAVGADFDGEGVEVETDGHVG
jgi:hypothetical protein